MLPPLPADHKEFVEVYDYLGRKNKFPLVECHISCPYYTGWAEVVSAPIKFCSALIGESPFITPRSVAQAVQTRAQRVRETLPTLPLTSTEPPQTDQHGIISQDFRTQQKKCESLLPLWEKARTRKIDSLRDGKKIRYEEKNGLLYRVCFVDDKDLSENLCIPRSHIPRILELSHDNLLAGHFGFSRTSE